MPTKPTILFVAITPPEYVPSHVRSYGVARTFDLIPHKHAVLALGAWLRENGCEAHYVWFNPGDGEGPSKVEKAIREKRPHALGFSLVTEELLSHYGLIERLKTRFPRLPVIVGGHHVTAEPIHTLENFPLIDYVCIGEGERTLTEWLKLIAENKPVSEMRQVNGLAFRDPSYGIVMTAPRDKFPDINVLPDPAFDLIADPGSGKVRQAAFPIVGSYGCRFFCTFCAADHGNYRYVTPERLVNQIQGAQEKYGVDYFAIRDSFWPPTGAWLDEFCDLVEERGLKIHFHFETRAGTLNLGQWARLKRIGLQAVAVGAESGDPKILKSTKKAITLDMVRKTFADLHRVGIFSIAFFMFGNKGENRETVENSIEFMHEINPSLVSLSTFRPLPGTEAYAFVKEEDKDWWMRGPYPSICEFATKELDDIRGDVHIRYPLRWAYLRQHVLNKKLPIEFREVAWCAFCVHLRKYALGISERYEFMRPLIYGAKKLIKREA